MQKIFSQLSSALLAAVLISGCSTTPPENPQNLCSIFQEKDSWYAAAHAVHNKYGIPINVAMAIMFQESGFVEDSKPPMRWWLGFIPYGRGSSSRGYAQAQDPVWEQYVDEAGSIFSDREDFDDALDFIGWYMTKTQQINGIAFSDAYNQYLNYHEGWSGYAQKTYENKDWLINIARQVQARSETYRAQLLKCELY